MHDDDDREQLQRRRRALGDRLRSLRAYRNLSQDDLVARSRVGRNTVQRAEAGDSGIRVDALWKLADGLGVPVTWLLSDELPAEIRGGPGGGDWPDGAPPVHHL